MRVPVVSSRLVHPDLAELELHAPVAAPPFPLIHLQALTIGFPSIRGVADDRPRNDGTDDDTAYHGSSSVSVTARLWGDDTTRPWQLRDQLAAFCWPGRRPELIYLPDGDSIERRVLLRADQMSAPVTIDRRTSLDCQVSWVCPSGIQESADEQSETAFPFTTAPGVAVPFDVPFDLPASTGGSTAIVNNAGNYKAWWTARIYGPAVSVRLRNLTHDLDFYLPFATIGAGDYLEIDAGAQTARLNSDPTADRYDFIDFTVSDWWQLQPGTNELEFSALTWSGAAQTVITWRHAWI